MPGPPRSAPVPAAGVERARAWLAGRVEPVTARDAATVLLLRDGGDGLEVYLQLRSPRLAFAGGMHAFPGGAVDPSDHGTHDGTAVPWADPPGPEDVRRLGTPGAALQVAAARECLEECGVLLAVDAAGEPAGAVPAGERRALLAGSLPFARLLAGRGLRLSAALLRPWSRWVTPEDQVRRFDTRFLVAALPGGQEPEESGASGESGGESTGGAWVRPAEAAAAHRRGERAMLLPTVATLGELAALPDVAAVLDAAASREAVPVLPRVVERDGRLRVEVP